jgi:hypothetical protein
MKGKLKPDKKAILGFFVQHGEKIIFAGVMVCFALIVYSAAARDMFPVGPDKQRITPEKLASYAGDAEKGWQQTVPDPEECKTPDYLAIVSRSSEEIEEGPYALEKAFDRPIIQQRRKRGEPPLCAVEGLRGTADCGQVATVVQVNTTAAQLPPGGGAAPRVLPSMRTTGGIQGQRWIVLVGLLPLAEQLQAYYDYFQTAQIRTPTDVPAYVGYDVQRLEVKSPDPSEPLDWSKSETFISGEAVSEAIKNWGRTTQMSQEVVDPKFLDKGQKLSFPLPPLVDRQWGESVAHPPEIPMVQRTYQGYPEPGAATPEGQQQQTDDPYAVRDQARLLYSPPAPDYTPAPQVYGGGGHNYDGAVSASTGWGGSGPGAPGYMGPGYGAPGARGRPYWRQGPGGPGYPGPGYAGPGYGAPTAAPYIAGQARGMPKYQLFRFFDFHVTPGKHYRYRVRLVLQNPNETVPDRFLSDDLLTEKKQIEDQAVKLRADGKTTQASAILRQWQLIQSDWSDPTDVISVPRDSRLLLVSVQPPTRTAGEPSSRVMVISWVEDRGIEAFAERQVDPGKVANFLECRFPETKQTRRPGNLPPAEETFYAPPADRLNPSANEPPPVNYVTETLVVDMHGGQRLGKDGLTAPGTILLLDPDGTLVVRHELDDLAECTQLRDRLSRMEQPGGGYHEGYGPRPGPEGYGPRSGYDRYGPRGGYDGRQPGRGGPGNLDVLRGGGTSYDGRVDKGRRRQPKSPPRRGGAS